MWWIGVSARRRTVLRDEPSRKAKDSEAPIVFLQPFWGVDQHPKKCTTRQHTRETRHKSEVEHARSRNLVRALRVAVAVAFAEHEPRHLHCLRFQPHHLRHPRQRSLAHLLDYRCLRQLLHLRRCHCYPPPPERDPQCCQLPLVPCSAVMAQAAREWQARALGQMAVLELHWAR